MRSVAIISLVLLSGLLSGGCSDGPSPFFQTANQGGAERSWSWPSTEIPPFDLFNETTVDALEVGFLAPPLWLGGQFLALPTTDHQIVLLRSERLYRTIPTPEGTILMPPLAADSTGRIFASSIDAELFALDTNGTLAWSSSRAAVPEESVGLPLYPLAIGEMVLSGNSQGEVVAFSREGKELWSRSFGSKLLRTTALSPGTGILVAQTLNSYDHHDTLTMLSFDGEVLWANETGGRIEAGPACSGEMVVVALSDQNEEGKYRPAVEVYHRTTGKLLWRLRLKVLPRGLAIDDEGTVYVSGGGGSRVQGGVVAAIGADGLLRWEVELEQSAPSTIAVSSNAVCFVTRKERSIGLFSYTREGSFLKFAPIETPYGLALPPTILPTGSLVVVSRERPLILKSRGSGLLF